jgi:lipoic acid synthetase
VSPVSRDAPEARPSGDEAGSTGAACAAAPGRKPAWLKVKQPDAARYRATDELLGDLDLHTVCREARCPNKGECYASGTATFLILGDVCTRSCRFCAVAHAGRRAPGAAGPAALCALDPREPARLAEAAGRLGLRHVVVTSVTRDDLTDGGAAQFAAAVAAVRAALPGATVELLVPDLGGDPAALAAVLAARPDVLGHNLETVPRLYPMVRPQARYGRSLEVLGRAAAWARSGATAAGSGGRAGSTHAGPVEQGRTAAGRRPLVKTGLMLGLGETEAEVDAVLADCVTAGVDLVTVGQYLQPEASCLPVLRYVTPDEFARVAATGAARGLRVRAAPFVRSSYRAGEDLGGGHPR